MLSEGGERSRPSIPAPARSRAARDRQEADAAIVTYGTDRLIPVGQELSCRRLAKSGRTIRQVRRMAQQATVANHFGGGGNDRQ